MNSNSKKKEKPRKVRSKPYKHYFWDYRLKTIKKVLDREDIHDVAIEMGITSFVIIYKWITKYWTRSEIALMSKREKIATGVYKTLAQLEVSHSEISKF